MALCFPAQNTFQLPFQSGLPGLHSFQSVYFSVLISSTHGLFSTRQLFLPWYSIALPVCMFPKTCSFHLNYSPLLFSCCC